MNRAYNMDCLDAMRDTPDLYFDLAVVDPPYGDVTAGGYLTGKSNGGVGPHTKHHDAVWYQDKPGAEYFKELFRISKNQIIWGGNYFSTEIARNSQCWLVWDKCHPEGIKFADAELAWTSFNSKTRVFRYMWNGMCQGSPGDGEKMLGDKRLNEKRIHPTQKPIALYTWIFRNYAKPGDRIIDTHLGSGSSRLAAYTAGLDFTGYEIDKTYFALQEERFLAYSSQVDMFVDGWADVAQSTLLGVRDRADR